MEFLSALAQGDASEVNQSLVQTVAILVGVLVIIVKTAIDRFRPQQPTDLGAREVVELLRETERLCKDLHDWHKPVPDQQGQLRFLWYETNAGKGAKVMELLQELAEQQAGLAKTVREMTVQIKNLAAIVATDPAEG